MKLSFFKKNIDAERVITRQEAMGKTRDPHKSWGIVIRVFFALLFIAMFYGGYLFYRTSGSKNWVAEESEPAAKRTINVAKLKSAIETYQAKGARFDEIKSSRPAFADPSI